MKKLSDLLNTFLNSFHFLSKSLKKIFRFLQHHSKKYRNVFPKIETICLITGYSPSTVKRATRYFAKMGWITKVKRPWQSNVYFMVDDLIKIDVNNSRTFKSDFVSQNDPIDDPVLKTSSEYKYSNKNIGKKEYKNNFKANPNIYSFLRSKKFSHEIAEELAFYPEYAVFEGFTRCIWYEKYVEKIQKPLDFFTKVIRNIIERK